MKITKKHIGKRDRKTHTYTVHRNIKIQEARNAEREAKYKQLREKTKTGFRWQ